MNEIALDATSRSTVLILLLESVVLSKTIRRSNQGRNAMKKCLFVMLVLVIGCLSLVTRFATRRARI